MVETQTFQTPDGAKIAYRIHGDANSRTVPLVLIMGLSGVMDDWSPFVEELAKTRRVLISDHRGIGASYVPSDWDFDLSHDTMIDDVLSLLCSLSASWSTFDVLGWSMGGHITQRLLTRPSSQPRPSQGTIEVLAGKLSVRKVILAATMTKLPRGDLDIAALQEGLAKIQDPKERKRWGSEQMMLYQYDDASLAQDEELKETMKRRIET